MDTNDKDVKQETDDGKLQELSCSNCGAPLEFDDEGNDQSTKKNRIKCNYCGMNHQFVAPKTVPTPGGQNYEVDQPVLVQWGQRWWKATVLNVVDSEHWLITYEGWSDQWDEVVGTDRIAPRPIKEETEGKGKWIAGGVVLAAILVVVFVFFFNQSDKDMQPHQEPKHPIPGEAKTAVAQPQFAAGDTVEVLWKGTWYKAKIKSVEANGDYNVHYDGYGDEWDERVKPKRVRKHN